MTKKILLWLFLIALAVIAAIYKIITYMNSVIIADPRSVIVLKVVFWITIISMIIGSTLWAYGKMHPKRMRDTEKVEPEKNKHETPKKSEEKTLWSSIRAWFVENTVFLVLTASIFALVHISLMLRCSEFWWRWAGSTGFLFFQLLLVYGVFLITRGHAAIRIGGIILVLIASIFTGYDILMALEKTPMPSRIAGVVKGGFNFGDSSTPPPARVPLLPRFATPTERNFYKNIIAPVNEWSEKLDMSDKTWNYVTQNAEETYTLVVFSDGTELNTEKNPYNRTIYGDMRSARYKSRKKSSQVISVFRDKLPFK